MYVAATRAAFWLGCSGYWWGDGASASGRSPFLPRCAPLAAAPAVCTLGAAAGAGRGEPRAREPAAADGRHPGRDATRPRAKRLPWSPPSSARVTRPRPRRRCATDDTAQLDPRPDLVAAWRQDAELLLTSGTAPHEGGLRLPCRPPVGLGAGDAGRDPAELPVRSAGPCPAAGSVRAPRHAFHQCWRSGSASSAHRRGRPVRADDPENRGRLDAD